MTATSCVAIALVFLIPWVSALQGIGLGCLGFAFGLLWQTRAEGTAGSQTGALVSAMASALVGALWGAVSASSTATFLVGIVIFCITASGWGWYVSVNYYWLSISRVWFCVLVAITSYAASGYITKCIVLLSNS